MRLIEQYCPVKVIIIDRIIIIKFKLLDEFDLSYLEGFGRRRIDWDKFELELVKFRLGKLLF